VTVSVVTARDEEGYCGRVVSRKPMSRDDGRSRRRWGNEAHVAGSRDYQIDLDHNVIDLFGEDGFIAHRRTSGNMPYTIFPESDTFVSPLQGAMNLKYYWYRYIHLDLPACTETP
jgi:hypothetical protein